MDKFAVIVAGGTGTRMGHETPKQFLPVAEEPVLVHTVRAFRKADQDISIILVLPAQHLQRGQELMAAYFPDVLFHFATGGATRFESVRNGLALVAADSIVFVHDAVRCLISENLIRRCYDTALAQGSAIPVIPVKDSIRRITDAGSEMVNRDELRAVQTPQTFQADILLKAFGQDYRDAFTDEATVLEFAGGSVCLVEGEEFNIKITYPSDLLLAEQFLRNRGVIS
jgi:2-C-methyl-D-erythritol 4-phosphate cytidylyltransferase